ncbi:alpha-galactosidase/6-phospho-beta-glucosidase family protein [Pseudonocardia eucalypti]|nr:alpha-galactosidase/6-phospho-beta-glucosidase family protein [Pseudonocardia eucalypti]
MRVFRNIQLSQLDWRMFGVNHVAFNKEFHNLAGTQFPGE